MNDLVQEIRYNEILHAIVIRKKYYEALTTTVFVSPPECPLQIGFLAYPEAHSVLRHKHPRIQIGTVEFSECTIVVSGSEEVNIYAECGSKSTVVLEAGDILVVYNGWHDIKTKTTLLAIEVKLGPYRNEKEFS